MGLGTSIHQSLTFFRRQHSETKSAKMVSKCYKKRRRQLYFSIDKMSVFYSSLHKILLPANMGGGSVLLFVFQRIFLDFYEKNYIVLKLRKNHSFRARFLSRKISQTISTLQHTFTTKEGQHIAKVGQCLFHLYSKASTAGLRFLTSAEHRLQSVFSLASTWGSLTALQCRVKDIGH